MQIQLEDDRLHTRRPSPSGRQDRPVALIPEGHDVEVRNRFEDHWVNGFAVAESGDSGYRLRRLSDGRVLPTWFAHDAVRPRP